MPQRPLLNIYGGVTNGSTGVSIDSDQLLPAEWWQVNPITVCNQSGEGVTFTYRVVKGADSWTLAAGTASVNNNASALILPVLILTEGWKLRITATGSALSGPFFFIISGWRGTYPVAGAPIPPLAAAGAQEYYTPCPVEA